MTESGGIAVTGSAVRVSIIGADCCGTIPSYNSQPPADGPQPYGISVSGTVTQMQVRGCNLSGNGESGDSPLYVATPGADLRVTDSPGYNDQPPPGNVLSSGAPPTGAFSNTSAWPNVAQGWYGPIVFYIWGPDVSGIEIDGVTTTLVSGGFTLGQGESATINTTGLGRPSFLAVGK